MLQFPDVRTVVRPNGDSMVELKMANEVVGEINFTKVMRHVFEHLGILKPERGLRVIK